MSRRWLMLVPTIATLLFSTATQAQDTLEAQSAQPPERIDLTIDPEATEPQFEDCSDEQEAASLSGEIIVCRRRIGDENRLYDRKEAERRHAERTQGQKPVDLFGIPDHGIVVARGCFIPPCPPPAAILIDVEALPEAPPGSDADRIARGLAPLGRDSAPRVGTASVPLEAGVQANADELGLPPAPTGGQEPAVSLSGSASPEDRP